MKAIRPKETIMLIAFSAMRTLRTSMTSDWMCLGRFPNKGAEMGTFCFQKKRASKLGIFQVESIKWMGPKILHYVWRLKIIPIVVVFAVPRWFVTASQWYNQECDIIISKLNFQLSSKSNSPNFSIQDRTKRSSPAKTHGSSLSQPPWRPHPWTWIFSQEPGSLRIGTAYIIVMPICVNQTSGIMDWKKKTSTKTLGPRSGEHELRDWRLNMSGQIITTSAKITPNGGLISLVYKGIPPKSS